MTDMDNTQIQVALRLGLADYIILHLWCRWVNIFRAIPVLVLAGFAGICIGMSMEGIAFIDLGRSLAAHWPKYTALVLVGILAVIGLPAVQVLMRWPSKSLAREARFTFDSAGVHQAANEVEMTLAWSSITSYSDTAAALYIRTKRLFLRLPSAASRRTRSPRYRHISKAKEYAASPCGSSARGAACKSFNPGRSGANQKVRHSRERTENFYLIDIKWKFLSISGCADVV